ncbi:MAG: hypothetical protein Q8N61_01200 [bacterium]|nr:hypothetical protein [bacterium]
MEYNSLSDREEEIAKAIVEAAVTTQPLRHQGTTKVMEYKPLSEREFVSL